MRRHPDPGTRANLIEIFSEAELERDYPSEIATLYSATEGSEGEANAHLIAAAPELLEALKEAHDALLLLGADQLSRKARAVIAKAEGRAQ